MNTNQPKTISIDNVTYIQEGAASQTKAAEINGLERCIIRSYAAGVFVGDVKEKTSELNGINVTLIQSKRIHFWDGACSLTQLSIDGTTKTKDCRVTDAIDSQFIANVIEILPITQKAADSIDSIPSWKK